MSLRTLLFKVAALALLFLSFQTYQSVFSQANNQAARKFDEFGDVQYSDLIARLDNFAVTLQNEPNTRGFIIVYRTRRDIPGLSSRYAFLAKNYLVKSRGVDQERVVTVDGGVASCLIQELWIVPVGATPTPRSDAYSRQFTDIGAARKFDEFYFSSPHDEELEAGASSNAVDEFGHLEGFATALQSEPRSRAYIIGYAQYDRERSLIRYTDGSDKTFRRTRLDPPGLLRRRLRMERDALIKTYRIAPSRITVVDGGYRTQREIELWIVPQGVAAPIPTPNAFPAKRAKHHS